MADKDVGKIAKNSSTDIVVRIDAFGGKPGLTIREFVNGADGGYRGFTKSGTRIPADKFLEFREIINSVNLEELKSAESSETGKPQKKEESSIDDY